MMPEVLVPERFNAASYFIDRHLAEGRADRIALICGFEEVTYRQLHERVNRMGNCFRELGIEMEDRVALILLDSPEFFYSYFGAMKIGAIPVPVNTLLTARDYLHQLNDCRARVIVVSEELLPAIEPILSDLPHLTQTMVVGEAGLHDFMAGHSAELEPEDTHRHDMAYWLYTSGTTGQPRAAVHLHHTTVSCAQHFGTPVFGLSEHDRVYSIGKLFFAWGLNMALYHTLDVGGTSILYRVRPEPSTIFDTVARHRPDILYGVPTAFAKMLHAVEQGMEADMSSVRLAVSAGEPLPAPIYHRWLDRFGMEILDAIGSTEVANVYISNRPGQVRPGSSGTVTPGHQLKIVDDDGNPVPEGEIGNLMVRAESTCTIYWHQHELTRRTFKGEWIRTGDKYRVDADGYYWYAGRADDMLKVSGIWVSPLEVESIILDHPDVLECAVVGVPDTDGLIKPKAFVVLKDPTRESDCMTRAIQEFAKTRMALYKYPRWIEFVSDLPKTASGKIRRFQLREGAIETLLA